MNAPTSSPGLVSNVAILGHPGSGRSLRQRVLDGELGGYVLLAPAIAVLLLLTIWPLIFSVAISFTDFKGGAATETNIIGLGNYQDMVADPLFTGSLQTTAAILVIAVPLQLILSYLAARVLVATHDMIGTRVFRTFFILPTMMTSLAVALFWRYITDPAIGIANFVLGSLGLPTSLFLADPTSAFVTVIFMYLWQWVPFTSMLIMAGLLGIPREIHESAAIDGAGPFQRIRHIDVPLLHRVFAVAGILATVEVIRLFDLIYGATQGGPGTATFTTTLAIFRSAFQNFDTAYAATGSLVILVITILVSQLFVRAMREERSR